MKKKKTNGVAEEFPRMEYMPIDELQPWSRNPKLHDMDVTMASIRRFGFTAPVLLDEDTQKTIAGHGRTEALRQIKAQGAAPPKRVKVDEKGQWCIPVIRGLTFESEQEAEAYLIADNRIGELGGWDDEMLKEMLEELRESGEKALAGVGYKSKDVDALIRETNEDRAEGPKPEEQLDNYLESSIRQVVLFFEGKEYDSVIKRLDAAQEKLGMLTYTDVFKKLLDDYDGGEPETEKPAKQRGEKKAKGKHADRRAVED